MKEAAGELEELRAWTGTHGLQLADEQCNKLANYLELLRLWSERMALVGARERPLLVRKHLADSLYVASRCGEVGRAADLGSGGGLPGIPVAIARPGLQIDLVESRGKKASFLAQASQALPNAHPLARRIESLDRGIYDLVMARALAPLDRLLPLARPLLRPGGALFAMKSAAFEDELAAASASSAGFALAETHTYELPSGEPRALLVFETIGG